MNDYGISDFVLGLGEKIYPDNTLMGWAILIAGIFIIFAIKKRIEEQVSMKKDVMDFRKYALGKRSWYEFWR